MTGYLDHLDYCERTLPIHVFVHAEVELDQQQVRRVPCGDFQGVRVAESDLDVSAVERDKGPRVHDRLGVAFALVATFCIDGEGLDKRF